MINKIDTSLAKLTKRKRRLNTVRDEKDGVATETTEIQRIIRDYTLINWRIWKKK